MFRDSKFFIVLMSYNWRYYLAMHWNLLICFDCRKEFKPFDCRKALNPFGWKM